MTRYLTFYWLLASSVVAALWGCSSEQETPTPKPREAPAAQAPEPVEDPPPMESPGPLVFKPPAEWVKQPARPMTKAVYKVPKIEGDSEDADLAVSHFPGMKDVLLEDNLARWRSQFLQPNGQPVTEVNSQSKLEGAAHPTTVIDISGNHKSGSMMRPGPIKEGYRMLVAEIRTGGGPWFVKLVGPDKTVAHWQSAYESFLREVK